MVREGPAFPSRDVSGSHRGLDLPPGAVGGKAYHGIPNPCAGAAGLAGRVGLRRRTDRNSPSGRRTPRQRRRAVTPFADRLGPFIRPPFEPVPNGAARVGSGEHGHNGGDPQLGQPIRMRGVVGRQVEREAGLDGVERRSASGLFDDGFAPISVIAPAPRRREGSTVCGHSLRRTILASTKFIAHTPDVVVAPRHIGKSNSDASASSGSSRDLCRRGVESLVEENSLQAR